MDSRDASRRLAAAFAGVLERICLPLQPSVLPYDRLQLRSGLGSSHRGADLRRALLGRLGPPGGPENDGRGAKRTKKSVVPPERDECTVRVM